MPTKNPAVWSDFLTAIGQITAILILVCALAGPAQQYSKGEKMFNLFHYLAEVVTSMVAGFIVYLLLRVTEMHEEWIAAFSGLGAYFGNRIMNLLYRFMVGKLKIAFYENTDKKLESLEVGGKDDRKN